MQITASLVNELRQKTGVGMMQCKKALTETDGDMDKAVELLRKQGAAVAAKRADKAAKEGRVYLVETGLPLSNSLAKLNPCPTTTTSWPLPTWP